MSFPTVVVLRKEHKHQDNVSHKNHSGGKQGAMFVRFFDSRNFNIFCGVI